MDRMDKPFFLAMWRNSARNRLRTFSRRQDGAAAVEYVILLGLIILSAAGGAYFLAGTADRVFSLAATPASDKAAGTTQAASHGNLAGSATEKPGDLTATAKERPTRLIEAVATGLAASLIALGWIVLRRRRQHCRKYHPLPQSEFAAADLRDRFFYKRQDLLRLLSNDGGVLLRNQMEVRHLMTTDAVVVSPETPCGRVNELMQASSVRHLLVCDANRNLLGVISNRDLCGASTKTAADLMSTHIQTVAPNTSLSPAITHLINEGISCLPVMDDGRLCGILTTTDLILALQCTLQLWLHAAQTMRSEAWEEKMSERLQSQASAADPNTCCGLKDVFETLMAHAEANLETAAP